MSAIEQLIRADLKTFNAYSSARKETQQQGVYLNANESPWDNTGQQLNRYPEPQAIDLLNQLAELYQLKPDNILLSRGSDEGIDLLTRLFCQAGQDAVLSCQPSFGMYAVSAQLQAAQMITVPLEKKNNFAICNDNILAAWQDNVKLVFLCSPNNPTGNSIPSEDIVALCSALQGKSMVVVDEAYIEYAEQDSIVKQLKQHDNLIILRTFSKAYGLAGIRCGVVLAHATIIQYLRNIIAPYPIPVPSIQQLSHCLLPENLKKIKQQLTIISAEKYRLADALNSLPLIKKVWPSDANFLLVECVDAKHVFTQCLAQGIILRDMSSKPQLAECLRISIGLPAENQRLLELLTDLSQ